MSTWENIPAVDAEELVEASSTNSHRFRDWRTIASATAIVCALILVVAGLSTSRFTPSGPTATGGLVNLQASNCVPARDCWGCADEETCSKCQITRDCRNCSKEGKCDECFAAAALTCCEKMQGEGGKRNREQCCERPELKDKTPLCTRTCAANYDDCGAWQCCQTEGWKCYTKDADYAQCRPGCASSKVEDGKPDWDCDALPAPGEGVAEPLQCAAEGENCRESRCCQDQGMSCYEKDNWWSSCRKKETCIKGLWEAEKGNPWYTNWTCKLEQDVQMEKVKTFDRRRVYYKPVQACEKLGDGWFPVPTEARCQDLSTIDSSKDMIQTQEKYGKVSGCSFNYGTQQYEWNKEPGSYKKCSDQQACVCHRDETIAPYDA